MARGPKINLDLSDKNNTPAENAPPTGETLANGRATAAGENSTTKILLEKREKRKQKNQQFIGIVVGVITAVLVAGVTFMNQGAAPNEQPATNDPTNLSRSDAAQQTQNKSPTEGSSQILNQENTPSQHSSTRPSSTRPLSEQLVSDDGQMLWASPTNGKPLTLNYLPLGTQIIVVIRPHALLKTKTARETISALGPQGNAFITEIKNRIEAGEIDFEWSDVESLTLGLQTNPAGKYITSYRILFSKNVASFMTKQQPAAALETEHGETFFTTQGWCYYVPKQESEKILVITPQNTIQELLALEGEVPPLARGIESLMHSTDTHRIVTMLFSPKFLFGDGRELFTSSTDPLRKALFWFWEEKVAAIAISLHWDDERFFTEMRIASTLDQRSGEAAKLYEKRMQEIAETMETKLFTIQPSHYSRRILGRFPAMLRSWSAYTRVGVERREAIIRSYLPLEAGHNLLLGAELSLAELRATPGETSQGAAGLTVTPTTQNLSAKERLQQQVSLVFRRDTLETALQLLSEEIGVEIVLVGPDLKLDGITKNQSFGLEMREKNAEKILQEIVRLANPDKSATSLNDPLQKLLYVLKPKKPGERNVIFVTTRNMAKQRGDKLPTVFVLDQP